MCDSTTWCEYRCDVCWKRNCNEYNNYSTAAYELLKDILYDDVASVIHSYIR